MLRRSNEDRLATVGAKVDGLAGQMREQRQEMREQRQEMRQLRQEMKAGFERVDDRFARMQWIMFGTAVSIIITLIGALQL
jgi:uncharacterized coiled-coil protein SlyX